MFTERQKQLIENAVTKALNEGKDHGCVIIWDPEHRGGIAANFSLKGKRVHIQARFITEKQFENHMSSL